MDTTTHDQDRVPFGEDHDGSPTTPPPPPPPAAGSGGDQGPRSLSWRQWIGVGAVGALGAALVVAPVQLTDDGPSAAAPAPETTSVAPASDDEPTNEIAAISDQVSPSVARVDAQRGEGPGGSGAGSAIVYREDGILVTNAHVVRDAEQVTVTLPDGEAAEAEVLGADPSSDLAVLEIDRDDLPVPDWAESGEVPQVGETAVAIGSPFGLDGSVTAGIVSALDRTVTAGPDGEPLVGMIQTDAPINPGNSGGALVDGSGSVIGVNTAIASSGGGSQGVGFSIPTETVRSIADQLIEDGSVEYAQLGVVGQTVNPDVAEAYGLPTEPGAAIIEVQPDSPAAEAGLAEGDLITGFAGEEITSMADLVGAVQAQDPGDEVELTVLREDEERQATTTLVERPEQQPEPDAEGGPGPQPGQPGQPGQPEAPSPFG